MELNPASSARITALIKNFLDSFTSMQFDKAREVAETERARVLWSTTPPVKIWQNLLATIGQVAVVEGLYFSLSFFMSKFSFRKENHIRDTYAQLRTEFQRSHDAIIEQKSSVSDVDCDLICDIAREFITLTSCRMELIAFYMGLSGKDWKSVVDESIIRISEIQQILQKPQEADPTEPTATNFGLCQNCEKELDVLQQLFQIQRGIAACSMVDSLIRLKNLRLLLTTWFSQFDTGIQMKPSTSFALFSFTKKTKSTSTKLALLHFLNHFYQTLLAKFSLYFNDVLVPYSPTSESKMAINANGNNNFIHFIHLFAKKNNPQMICILANRLELDTPFYGFGYHKFLSKFSNEYCKPAIGINEKYPPLFIYPQDKRLFDSLHVNIISFVQDIWLNQQNPELIDGKIKHLFDKNKEQSFFTACIEANIHLVVVFDRRVQEKDGPVVTFFNDALQGLRLVKLFQDLRNFAK
ncbi:KICSTOR complex protein C12orf66 like protein [Ditylenchus destructor]|nr:KICSTOR complex protein C12orf66 like protein [Ditylenchus destructor]